MSKSPTIRRASLVRRPTPNQRIIAGLKQDLQSRDDALRNANSALQAKKLTIETLERQVSERDTRISANTNTIADSRDRVNRLKVIVSDLERQFANAQGYIRAMRDRADADSPVVEIPQPPMLTTRARIAGGGLYGEDCRHSGGDLFRGDLGCDGKTSAPKHWTAI